MEKNKAIMLATLVDLRNCAVHESAHAVISENYGVKTKVCIEKKGNSWLGSTYTDKIYEIIMTEQQNKMIGLSGSVAEYIFKVIDGQINRNKINLVDTLSESDLKLVGKYADSDLAQCYQMVTILLKDILLNANETFMYFGKYYKYDLKLLKKLSINIVVQ